MVAPKRQHVRLANRMLANERSHYSPSLASLCTANPSASRYTRLQQKAAMATGDTEDIPAPNPTERFCLRQRHLHLHFPEALALPRRISLPPASRRVKHISPLRSC